MKEKKLDSGAGRATAALGESCLVEVQPCNLKTPRAAGSFPDGTVGKESPCHCRRGRFNPWVNKIPWGRPWQPTPVFLPGKSHGQRCEAGHSPWGRKGVGHN